MTFLSKIYGMQLEEHPEMERLAKKIKILNLWDETWRTPRDGKIS